MQDRYFHKVIGNLVYLSPVNLEDSPYYAQWLNDLEVTKYLNAASMNFTYAAEKEALEKLTKSGVLMGIIKKDADRLIGNVGLHNVDYIHGTAELGIFIGEKNYWNRGYGTEAVTLMVDMAFNLLNLNTVYMKVFDYNKRALRAYEKAGFKKAGTLRAMHHIAGKRYDVHLLDIVADEFKSPYIKTLVEDDSKERDYGKKIQLMDV